MSKINLHIDFYSGTQIEVLRLKYLLEREVILQSIIQNDFQSGNPEGFRGGNLNTVSLKNQESD